MFTMRFLTCHAFRSLTFLLLTLCLTGCGSKSDAESDGAEGRVVPVDPAAMLDKDSPQLPEQPPSEPLGQALEELTATWSKVVWMQHDNPDSADTYATGSRHYLWGLDSRDGQGVRQLLEKRGNYSRPMITPDGRMILYTDKQVTREGSVKHYEVTVMATDWQGAEPLELADGYASDIWRDPETGHVWVIAARDLLPSERASMFARKLVRFRLDDPSIEEVLWDRTRISLDSIQLSRDGRKGSGLFPWPDIGFFDFANNDWQRLAHGCWPSHSPDNSYITWAFDGAHRNLTMFVRDGSQSWTVPVNRAPGVDGAEVYHPRWSNHPRFLSITGPYVDGRRGENPITVGGTHAEIYIGRFSEDLTEVEAWVCLTDNDVGDFYPDLWVHNGHKEVLANFPQGPQETDTAASEDAWPATGSPLLFAWHHRNHRNQFTDADGETRPFQLQGRGLARFGRHHHALLDAGHFEPDNRSAEAIREALTSGGALTIECLVSADAALAGAPGILWSAGTLALEVTGGALAVRQGDSRATISMSEGDGPWHIVTTITPDGPATVWINGEQAEVDGDIRFSPADDAGFQIGGGAWGGGVERIALYRAALDPAVIAALASGGLAATEGREPVPVLRLRGKLVQTTPVPSEEEIDPYTSALVEYIYDVEEVLAGDYDHDQVLVRHWGLLDREVVPGFPRTLGESYELVLQPWDRHPQLEGERRTEETGNFVLPVLYDIAPAKP